jgi:hypothetical protein
VPAVVRARERPGPREEKLHGLREARLDPKDLLEKMGELIAEPDLCIDGFLAALLAILATGRRAAVEALIDVRATVGGHDRARRLAYAKD